MNDRPSADIIAFPTTAKPAVTPAPDQSANDDPGVRLRTALAALDAALLSQRAAVADWRTAIQDLRGSMDALGSSLYGYRDNLGHLGGQVASLGDTARQLQTNADKLSGAPHG